MSFDETLQRDTVEHKELFRNHLEKVKSVGNEVQSRFSSALVESGIKPK